MKFEKEINSPHFKVFKSSSTNGQLVPVQQSCWEEGKKEGKRAKTQPLRRGLAANSFHHSSVGESSHSHSSHVFAQSFLFILRNVTLLCQFIQIYKTFFFFRFHSQISPKNRSEQRFYSPLKAQLKMLRPAQLIS